MLPAKESLTVEFKSEQKRPQSHDEIVDNVVALANTEGGTLYLGIEDDGTVTGVCDEHRNINGLAALIFNKTVPQLPARVALLYENEVPIISIEVGNSQQIVSTSQGEDTTAPAGKQTARLRSFRCLFPNSLAVYLNNGSTISVRNLPQSLGWTI